MFDFPNAPSIGQQIIEPNGSVAQWDGVKWNNVAGQVSSVAPLFNNVGRNLLHNSMFNIQQRGAGPWSVSGFTLDRWNFAISSDTSSTIQTAISDVDRAGIGDEAARLMYSISAVGNAAAGAFTVLLQSIEDVRRLAGKTVTISFWATCNQAGMRIGVSFDQIFGSGGSPSANIKINGQSIVTAVGWARYFVTLTLPSIGGKTVGTNNNDATVFYLWFSSGSTNAARSGNIGVQSCAFNIWGVQLEIGTVATQLEKIDLQQDLAKCQRFYATGIYNISGYQIAGGLLTAVVTLPVPMRNVPTFAITPTTSVNTSAPTLSAGSTSQGVVVLTATASAILSSYGNYTASADL